MPYIKHMSNKEYHASKAISSSTLVHALRSPAHFFTNWNGNPDYVPELKTEAMEFGSAVHAYLLEGDSFYQQYLVVPKLDKRTKEGKALHASFVEKALANGQEIIDLEDFETIKRMGEALKTFEIEDENGRVIAHSSIFKSGTAEESFFWTDPATGLELRCRSDWRIGNVLIDYKTTQDARVSAFRYEVAKRAYYMRAAMYLDGIAAVAAEEGFAAPTQFYFVAQEKKAPFAAAAHFLNPDDIEFGRQQYKQALKNIKSCMESGKWHGYARRVNPIYIPPSTYDEAAINQ